VKIMSTPTDWTALAADCEAALRRVSLRRLARELGVTLDSLQALRVGWREKDSAWTFPEFDGRGNIIGILRRYRDGRKKVMAGSQRGLYLPTGWHALEGTLYLPEGPTDVAALITHGLRAVGRPACTGGVQHLRDLLTGMDVEVLVVGEIDAKEDGKWPGRDGARAVAAALARDLGRRVRWTMPPAGFKDVREYLTMEKSHGA
jgi:hypothetical protein